LNHDKNVYELLKIMDNINGQITFNTFNNNKNKISKSYKSTSIFIKGFSLSCYLSTISFFLYTNLNYFMKNNYNLSFEESIYLTLCVLSVIIYFLLYDVSMFFVKKYFKMRYKKLINFYEKKEKTHLSELVAQYDFNSKINLQELVKEKLIQYHGNDNKIIQRVIKQTSFVTENKEVNDFIDNLF